MKKPNKRTGNMLVHFSQPPLVIPYLFFLPLTFYWVKYSIEIMTVVVMVIVIASTNLINVLINFHNICTYTSNFNVYISILRL